MLHCHNTPCCPVRNLVPCCTPSIHAAQYSPKLLYEVCPSLHHNSPKIAPKWQRKIVGGKCQNSKQKQFKITYLVFPLNHSKRSTRGTVSQDKGAGFLKWDFGRENREFLSRKTTSFEKTGLIHFQSKSSVLIQNKTPTHYSIIQTLP